MLQYFYKESSWLLSHDILSRNNIIILYLFGNCFLLLQYYLQSQFICCSADLMLSESAVLAFVVAFQASRTMSVLLQLCVERLRQATERRAVDQLFVAIVASNERRRLHACSHVPAISIVERSLLLGMSLSILQMGHASLYHPLTGVRMRIVGISIIASDVHKNNHRASILDLHTWCLRSRVHLRHASVLFCDMCILHLMSLASLRMTSRERHRH